MENIRLACAIVRLLVVGRSTASFDRHRFLGHRGPIDQPSAPPPALKARLGFRMVASVDPEPDVLLIGGVLAVGDRFSAKCIDRIRQLVAGGTTVVIVSHFEQASVCGRFFC